jgi:hypothetical protein
MYRNKQKEGTYTMSAIIRDLQDAFVTFVKERVSAHKWKELTTKGSILRQMEDDDMDELKDYFWEQMLDEVKWFVVLDEVEKLATQNQELQGEEEEDCSRQSSDEEE